MKPGDLVKVAARWSGYEPIFSETDAFGMVINMDAPSHARSGRCALVLINGCETWVALQNMEVINASR